MMILNALSNYFQHHLCSAAMFGITLYRVFRIGYAYIFSEDYFWFLCNVSVIVFKLIEKLKENVLDAGTNKGSVQESEKCGNSQ